MSAHAQPCFFLIFDFAFLDNFMIKCHFEVRTPCSLLFSVVLAVRPDPGCNVYNLSPLLMSLGAKVVMQPTSSAQRKQDELPDENGKIFGRRQAMSSARKGQWTAHLTHRSLYKQLLTRSRCQRGRQWSVGQSLGLVVWGQQHLLGA